MSKQGSKESCLSCSDKKQTYAHLGEFWSYTYHFIYLPYLAIAKFSNLKQMNKVTTRQTLH